MNSRHNHPVLSLLGIAYRARQLVSGDTAVLDALRSRSAKLVIVASDASQQAQKKYTDKCATYATPLVIRFTRQELGKSIGKPERVVIALLDDGFSNGVRERIAQP